MHRGGIEELLEVRAREAKVSTPAEVNAPDPLRQATLHPGPQRIRGFELRGPLALPRRLERLMVAWWPDHVLVIHRARATTTCAKPLHPSSPKPAKSLCVGLFSDNVGSYALLVKAARKP
jgi:hypothetical protein